MSCFISNNIFLWEGPNKEYHYVAPVQEVVGDSEEGNSRGKYPYLLNMPRQVNKG